MSCAPDESSFSSLCGRAPGYNGNPASLAVACALKISPASLPSLLVTVTFTPLLSFSCPVAPAAGKISARHKVTPISAAIASSSSRFHPRFFIPPSSYPSYTCRTTHHRDCFSELPVLPRYERRTPDVPTL